MIGIIDYRTGNSQSISFALEHLGVPHALVTKPGECDDVDKYILPGVGAAGVTMESLAQEGWIDHLNEKILGEGQGFLGVCVGLQVLFERSDEDDVECLGWLKGSVREFDKSEVRVPHMGWNNVEVRGDHPFSRAFTPDGFYYFVNSFYAVPAEDSSLVGVTTYGQEFAAAVAHKNIMATQFHTEKSARAGLQVLKSFCDLDVADLKDLDAR
ncbi:imidazole glycerol phosphate synthase subunit HisH [Cellulomonas fengjieae]|uniref:Imidazole glycerol phosphate synthase subunit HisH n=1 Tax=Cellulomonas fengjieae TaxID=2819978 RepID=A0ABS3SI88_9CELL|nr:imidazole glycerol phosphate synthase subunit HisH [Cellulomonas fengjieae]MBO3085367.1 imidazole glycerol phosphate synthase subunit HisH [Cellulomonas fengjieae]QVI66080.1 imidazole glycerol phosphate synthase subunit HisH [Cellulomonas fengjieae]